MNLKDHRPVGPVAVFLLGVGLSLTLGITLRLALSPGQLRLWVNESLSKAKTTLDIQFDQVQLKLSDGFWPRFGLEVRDLNIQRKESSTPTCHGVDSVFVKSGYIPFSLWDILRGKVRFGRVVLSEVAAAMVTCPVDSLPSGSDPIPQPVEPKSSTPLVGDPSLQNRREALQKVSAPLNQLVEYLQLRWSSDMEKAYQWLGGVRIEHFTLNGFEKPWKALSFSNVDLKFNFHRKEANLQADIQIAPSLLGGVVLQGMNMGLRWGTEDAELKLSLSEKEADLSAKFFVDVVRRKVRWEWQVHHLPASDLIQATRFHSDLQEGLSTRRLWMNCRVSYEGGWSVDEVQPINLSNCGIQGELGNAFVHSAQIDILKPWEEWNLQIKLVDLSLRQLLSLFKRDGPSGIFNHFGQFNGYLVVDGGHLRLLGTVENLELTFSRGGHRGWQKISRMHTDLVFRDHRISGLIPHIELEGGEFEGFLSFNVDPSFSDGLLQIRIDRLAFQDPVQELMLGGKGSAFVLYGQAQFEKGMVQRYRGHAGLGWIHGENWSARRLRLSAEYDRDLMTHLKGKFQVDQLELASTHGYQKWLRPLFLDYEGLKEEIVFKDFVAHLEVLPKEVHWFKSRAYSLDRKVIFSSGGKWTTDQGLRGFIHVDFPVLKLLKWNLAGTIAQPQIYPSSQMLKEYAKRDVPPENKSSGEESLLSQLNFFKKILSKERLTKLKNLGQRVLGRSNP